MRKIRMAICEEQEPYRKKLAEYFICKKGDRLQISSFSGQKIFRKIKEEKSFDIVLLGKGFDVPAQAQEEATLYLRLSERGGVRTAGEEGIACIDKYQSGEELLRQVFSHYQGLGLEELGIYGKKKELIAVYSPCQSRMRTPFALTLAQVFSAEKKSLYVNMGEWAGFGQWFLEEYNRDLSDLLYMLSGKGSRAKGILESVTYSVNRMDYIPPMVDAQLLCQSSEEDYLRLFQFLEGQTDYEAIILDFGIMVPGFFSLLEQCSHIYGVLDQGSLANGQRQQFETGIHKGGLEHIAEKIEYVSFAMADAVAIEREPVLNQWLYGILGDKARVARGNQLGAY